MSQKEHGIWLAVIAALLLILFGLGARVYCTTITGVYDQNVLNDMDSIWYKLIRLSDTNTYASVVVIPTNSKRALFYYTYDDQTAYMLYLTFYFTGYSSPVSDMKYIWPVSGLWATQGTGAYTVDYYVLDTTGGDTTAVSGALVTFKDWGNLTGAVVKTAKTDASGRARISVDADSLAALVSTSELYSFPTTWDSMSWTANYQDTVYGAISLPGAATDTNYVLLYVDVGSGIIDSASGAMIPRNQITLVLELLGGSAFYDGSWIIAPKTQRKQPNSAGRATFTVEATTVLTSLSGGSPKYRLSYEAFDGRSLQTGIIKTFILDTIPDPINVLNATEVF